VVVRIRKIGLELSWSTISKIGWNFLLWEPIRIWLFRFKTHLSIQK